MMKGNAVETANVVASIAHDLRSPLNAVIGFSRLMLRGIDGPLSDVQTVDLEAVHTNGLAMLRMVDDLIDLARAEAGWFSPQTAAIQLDALLEKVLSLFQEEEATETQVVFHRASGDIERPIHVDRSQAQKALVRLIAAAARLLGSGKITLTTKADGEEAVVYVMASNPDGLPADTPHVLEAFCTAGASSEQRVDATALKLLASQQLLALSGGQLFVEAASDTEIRLVVRLPLAPL